MQAIREVIKKMQKTFTNKAPWQICLVRAAWKKLFASSNDPLVNLYIKDKKVFVKLKSLTLKHYITMNHDVLLGKLNKYGKEMNEEWINLNKIVLLHY